MIKGGFDYSATIPVAKDYHLDIFLSVFDNCSVSYK